MKPKEFFCSDVENYVTNFSNALIQNPNFENPTRGGAHKKAINVMFLQGLQPEHFRQQIEKFCTESVDESCDAIDIVLSTYDASVAMEKSPLKVFSKTGLQRRHRLLTRRLSICTTSAATAINLVILGTSAHPNVCAVLLVPLSTSIGTIFCASTSMKLRRLFHQGRSRPRR